jgi:hypothetical protein
MYQRYMRNSSSLLLSNTPLRCSCFSPEGLSPFRGDNLRTPEGGTRKRREQEQRLSTSPKGEREDLLLFLMYQRYMRNSSSLLLSNTPLRGEQEQRLSPLLPFPLKGCLLLLSKGETTFVPLKGVLGKGETTLLPLRFPLGISRLSLIDEGSEQEQSVCFLLFPSPASPPKGEEEEEEETNLFFLFP